MLLINCPFCGERDQSEFTNGGEAHVIRPKNPESVNDREWSEYVFIRSNPKEEFIMRDGFIHMDVKNGSMQLEIRLQTKF